MSLSIVADQNIAEVQRYFAPLGKVQLVDGRALRPEQLASAQVLLVRSVTRVDKTLLDESDIRFVGTATSGVDHIDRTYLAGKGVGFASAPGVNANSVVEYVLAAIAAVDDKLERIMEGATVGIVGYGAIGRALRARLQGLGIASRIYDPWLEQASIPDACGLPEVLSCEVITLHPELTRREPWPSFHLLGPDELARLHAGQLLLNAGRGELIDSRALSRCLSGGKGAVTVLDVWEGEPRIDPRLVSLTRLGSAHIAGYSRDGKLLGTRMLRDALLAHLQLENESGQESGTGGSVLEVPQDCTGPDLVRYLIQARYDIHRDDALLRSGLGEANPAAAFDRLRKEYRIRRELAGSAVYCDDCCAKQLAIIRGLGCVATTGKQTP